MAAHVANPGDALLAPYRSLVANEWQKLWVKKRWVLVIGLAILVVGGSLLANQTRLAAARATGSEMAFLRQAVAQTAQQLHNPDLSHKQRLLLRQNLAQEQQALAQLRANPTGEVNVAQDLKSQQALLAHLPPQESPDQVRLAVAQDRYLLAHGIRSYSNFGDSGWQLPGIVLGGAGLLLLGFLVVLAVSDLVTAERQDGTLPVLFLNAANRRGILAAKMTVAVAVTWGALLTAVAGWWVMGGLVMGFGSPWMPQAVNVVYAPYAPAGGTLAVASRHWMLLPQYAYDAWGLALAALALGAWASLVTAFSTLFRSAGLTTVLASLVLLSGLFASLLHGHPAIVADPTVSLSLLADWTGATALSTGVTQLTLWAGIAVWLGWLLVAWGFSLWRFERLEP